MRTQESGFEIPFSSYLKSGEFAKICNTTKETLRHYRDEGLIEPVFRAPNGYLYYSPLQISDFMLISALAKAGSPLEEISTYLQQPENGQLDVLIERNVERIRQKRALLFRQQRLLERTLARKRDLDAWLEEEKDWRIVECDEVQFLELDLENLFSTEGIEDAEGNALAGDLFERFFRNMAHNSAAEIQSVFRLGIAALDAGKPATDYALCLRVPAAKASRADAIKPAGRYFQKLRRIAIEDILEESEDLFDAYAAFLQEARKQGFSPEGSIFEQELSLYAGDIAEIFYTELSVRIG